MISSSRGTAIRGIKRTRIPQKLCISQQNGGKILQGQVNVNVPRGYFQMEGYDCSFELPFVHRRHFTTHASEEGIHVVVNGKNVDGASAGADVGPSVSTNAAPLEGTTTQSHGKVSLESISEFANKLKGKGDDKLDDLTAREITKAIDTLAHSIHKDDLGKADCNRRGELSWTLLKKVLAEDGLFDPNVVEENLEGISIEKDPRLLDHTICHNAIKCMAQSQNHILFHRADSIVGAMEEHFIKTKSKKIHPVGRSYALLLDGLRNFHWVDDDDIIQKVKDLLDRAAQQEAYGNSSVAVNRQIYNAALNVLASRSESSPSAVALVEDMMEKEGAPLDHASFSIAMKTMLSSNEWMDRVTNGSSNETNDDGQHSKTTPLLIEKLLLRMADLKLQPNQKIMTPILNALSKQGKVDQILILIDWMESMYQSHGWDSIRPNKIHFNTLLSALARSNNTESGIEALRLLDKMNHMHRNGDNDSVRPDLVTYNAVLNAISKGGNQKDSKRINNQAKVDMCARAEQLLHRMEDGNEGEGIVPDIVSYNAVLSTYMNQNSKIAAIKAQEILQRMIRHSVEPDLLSYTICINTLAKSPDRGAAQKAQDLLSILEDAYAEGNEELKPDMKCYNSVIHAWANSSEDDALFRANDILTKIKELRKSGERPDLVPDNISYTSIISALAKASSKNKSKKSAELLDAMMNDIQSDMMNTHLDSGVYNSLIHAKVHSGEFGAAEKAEAVLMSLIHNDAPMAVRPNTITFNTVIDAWSKSNDQNAAARAENLLKQMQKMHENGYPNLCPDIFSFASVLNAHANSREPGSARKAENILEHMESLCNQDGNDNVKPNTICYATVIKAYARSARESGSAARADALLRRMFEAYEGGNREARPNIVAFTSTCDAWSKSGERQAVKRVEGLMKWMRDLSAEGLLDVMPNEFTYNCLLTAVARSKDPNKAAKAYEILREMEDGGTRITSFAYSNVLNSCAYTHGTPSVKRNALRTAIIVLEEAEEKAGPQDRLNIVFGSFFQACANLMSLEKEKVKIEKVVEAAFYKCCDQGQVDKMLLTQVRRACSKQLFLRMFGTCGSFPDVSIKDIPSEWQKNVRTKHRGKYKGN